MHELFRLARAGVSRSSEAAGRADAVVCQPPVEALENRLLFHAGHAVEVPAPAALSPPVPVDGGAVVTDGSAAARAFAAGAWQPAAAAPHELFEGQGEVVGGKLYVFAGFYNSDIDVTQDAQVYDPAADVWSPLADAPIPESHAATATDGRLIYFAGGFRGDWFGDADDDFWTYDPAADAWARGPSLPEPVGAGALVLLGRDLHFFGGLLADGRTDSADHWALDLDQPAAGWVDRAPLPNPRNHLGYAALGGKAYAIGGQHALDEANGTDAAVHAYDPATNAWAEVAPLPARRSHLHNSTFVYDGRIVAAGGTDPGNVAVPDVIAYDPAANAWTVTGQLPEPRSATIAKAVGSRMVVTTGTPTGVLPQTDTWTRPLSGVTAGFSDGLRIEVAADPVEDVVIAGTRGRAAVRVFNDGGERFKDDAEVRLFLSTDALLDDADLPLATRTSRLDLKPERSKGMSLKFDYPEAASGAYHVLASVATPAASEELPVVLRAVSTSTEMVSVAARTIDLAAVDIAGTSARAGRQSSVTVVVRNVGNEVADGPLTFTVAAAPAAATGTPADAAAGPETPLAVLTQDLRLAAGRSKRIKVKVPLPAELPAADYVLSLRLNPDPSLADVDPSNDALVGEAPFTIR